MEDLWDLLAEDLRLSRRRRRERLAERERERAEVENLRAELLNDPHTLLLLPDIRMWLYKMSFTDPAHPVIAKSSFQSSFCGWGYTEKFFQVCNAFLNIAKSHSLVRGISLDRSVKNTTYYYLVGLDILLTKAIANSDLCRVLASLICSTDTEASAHLSFEDSVIMRINSILRHYLPPDQCEDEGSASSAMVVAALVVLLYCVCQYLMLFVDRGRGSRSYSPGSLDFRDVYISIVLFLGAYIWIKSRQAATSGSSELKRKGCEAQDQVPGVYRRAVKDKSGTFSHYKYEPKFKPPREKLDSGTTLQFNCLSLGQYDTPGEAKFVFHCAAFYYGKAAGQVALEDGSVYAIPPMDAQENCLTGSDKAKWVTDRAKQVFKDLHPESAVKSRKQSRTSNAHSDPSHRFIAPFPGLSASADVERSETLPVELASTGAEVVADGGGSAHEAIPAPERSGVPHNVPGMENDARKPDGHGNASGHDDEATVSDSDQHMIAELLSGPANVSSQQSSLLGFVIPGDPSPPQFDHDPSQGFVGIPNLNCRQGLESFVWEAVEERDLQLLVSSQKKLLQEYAVQNADLHHQLLEADVKISKLERDNELLRAAKSQEAVAAKSQVVPWLAEFVIDFQQEEGRQFLGP